jgi:hypothetical protein
MPILGVLDSAQTGNLVTGSYESIATFTGGAGSFTFSSIPQTYTHLQLRVYANNTNGGGDWRGGFFRPNNDAGSNYWWHYAYRSGTSTFGTSEFQANSWGQILACITNSFNGACSGVYDIYDYTNTNKYKTLTFMAGLSRNGNTGTFAYGEVFQG